MDGAASAGDAGFDAALRALDELESNVAQQVPAPVAQPTVIAPALGIAIADEVEAPAATVIAPAPMAPMAAVDDLEAALNDSMAKVTIAPIEAAPAPLPAPDPAPPQIMMVPAKSEKTRLLPVLAASLGVLSSVLSVVGLLVASRTIADASLVVADARERQAQLVQVGKLVSDLELIRNRQLEIMQRQQLAANNAPLSGDQFNKAMDNLRIDFGKRGADATVVQAFHQGQIDTNNRVAEVANKLDRIEASMGARRF